jgi:CubicO group peptidase (beta-lactamase class C family)
MRSLLAVAIVLVAGCRTPTPHGPGDGGPRAPNTLDPAGIDRWVAAELARREIVGASLVVVYEGATVLSKGYGTRIKGKTEPIDANTPFAIGSVSKQLTCAAALTFVDEGKLSMKDPVAKWYPNLVRANDITLDDLGAHMSGYRDYYPLDYLDARMKTKIAPDDLIARYAGLPLDFEPRSRWSYSNTGFVLLGRIIEKVAGKPLGAVLEERIFVPLGMTHASVIAPPHAAFGHDAFLLGKPGPVAPEADGWLMGTASVYASASDLAKWDLAFGGGALLSDATRKQMLAPHRTTDGRELLYGCGIGMRVAGGEQIYQHTGAIEGFRAYNTFIPRIRAAVILLVNDGHAEVGDLHQKIVSLVLERPGDIPVVPGPSAEDAARAMVKQLQAGSLDRSKLGDDLNGYFDDKRIAEAAPRLRALGEPKVTLISRGERGGMEVTQLELAFPSRTLQATMFRSPIGKIHQFMILPD